MVLFLIVVLLWAGPGLSFFVKWEWVGGESSKFFQHSNVLREHPRYFNVNLFSTLGIWFQKVSAFHELLIFPPAPTVLLESGVLSPTVPSSSVSRSLVLGTQNPWGFSQCGLLRLP